MEHVQLAPVSHTERQLIFRVLTTHGPSAARLHHSLLPYLRSSHCPYNTLHIFLALCLGPNYPFQCSPITDGARPCADHRPAIPEASGPPSPSPQLHELTSDSPTPSCCTSAQKSPHLQLHVLLSICLLLYLIQTLRGHNVPIQYFRAY